MMGRTQIAPIAFFLGQTINHTLEVTGLYLAEAERWVRE